MAEVILLLQAASTLAMVGLIWFVQIVHYPLFGAVGHEQFAEYERLHQARTTWVVAPIMLVEAFTTVLLVLLRPLGVSAGAAVFGLVLLIIVWASTFFWQVPTHAKLGFGFSAAAHRSLVQSNWIRTAAWTMRGLLVCWMIGEVFLRNSAMIIAQLP